MLNQTIHRCSSKASLGDLSVNTSSYLQPEERELLQTIPNCKQSDFLSGRFLLKTLWVDYYGGATNDVSITYQGCRPVIERQDQTYYCSISHSTHSAAVAISTTPWPGIDIEELRTRSVELLSYIATPTEITLLPDSKYLATIVWNIKEAAFKADDQQRTLNDYILTKYHIGIASVLNTRTRQAFSVKHRIYKNTTLALVV